MSLEAPLITYRAFMPLVYNYHCSINEPILPNEMWRCSGGFRAFEEADHVNILSTLLHVSVPLPHLMQS